MRLTVSAWVLLATMGSPAAAWAASGLDFDCKAPKALFQEAVCADATLKTAYQRLSDALAQRLKTATEAERVDLSATQAGWLRWQGDHGVLPDPDEKPIRWKQMGTEDKAGFAEEYAAIIDGRILALTTPLRAIDFYRDRASVELRLPEGTIPAKLEEQLLKDAMPRIDAAKNAINSRAGKEEFRHVLSIFDSVTFQNKRLLSVYRQEVSSESQDFYDFDSTGYLWDFKSGTTIQVNDLLPLKTAADARQALAEFIHGETHEMIMLESAKQWTAALITTLLDQADYVLVGEDGKKAEGMRVILRWTNPNKQIEEQDVFVPTQVFAKWLLPTYRSEFE